MKRLVTYFSRLFSPLLGLQSSDVSTTLALTVGSPSAHRRGAMLKLMSVLVLVFSIGVGNAWGTDHTSTFSNSDALDEDSKITKNSAEWTLGTIVGAGSPTVTFVSQKWNNVTNQAIKVGWKANNYYSTITFTTDYFNDKSVSAVAIKFALNGGVSTTLTATQGGTTIGSTTYSTAQTWNTQTLNSATGNGGRLIITITTTQAILINQIKVTYNNTPHTITFHAGTGSCETASSGSVVTYTLPDATPPASCISEGWGFYGWATAAQGTETETAPAIVGKAGDIYRPGANVDLYAIYAQGEYTKETSTITSGSKYLIVGVAESDNYIMKSEPMEIYDGVDGLWGMNAIQKDETSSGKYSAASVNANWCYTIEGTAGNYVIRDVVNSSSSNYADIAYSKWWGRDSEDGDEYTITVSAGAWTIQNNYYDEGYTYLGLDNTDLAFFGYGSAQDILLYKETTTPKYHSSPSCASCGADPTVTGASNNGSFLWTPSFLKPKSCLSTL